MLQLHLSDQQFHCLLRCYLYERFDGNPIKLQHTQDFFLNTLYMLHDNMEFSHLTHWGPATHICFSKLTIIGSDNGLSPGRRQVITWTNDGILLIGPLGTNFSEILSKIHTVSFKKMHLKTSSAKWRPFCISPNVLTNTYWNLFLGILWHAIRNVPISPYVIVFSVLEFKYRTGFKEAHGHAMTILL